MALTLDLSAKNRVIDLDTPLDKGMLVAERLAGTETLGRMFNYELTALSSNGNIKFDDVLGHHVTARVQLEDGSRRCIDGRVSQIGLVGMVESLYRYRLVLRPWTWMLTRTADCRIFQEKNVKEILEEVFADQPDADFDFNLTAEYVKRVYCVQYRETDFAFVSRLMEEEGIYYFFRHEQGKHTLVICDAPGAHDSLGSVPYMPQERSARAGREHIHEWSVTRQIQPTKVALRDYNFEKPSTDLLLKLEQDREHAEATHEIYDYPGEYQEMPAGEHLIRARLDELQAGYETVEGRGNARILACGGTFTFTDYGRQDQNGDFLIVSTRIDVSNNLLETARGEGETRYDVTFQLLRASEPYRAERSTPRPIVQGPQTAVVVGPSGEEIFVDKYGRVKVQFHWDRYGKKDDKSSCWIRVSQIWAGKNYGWMTIPRIGQEVVVDFLEGNPDEPLITGRVYNAEQMPPWGLPDNKTQSGILTRSSAGGSPENANHLKFEDKKGDELIDIHAEKNMSTHVENDDSTFVGNDQSLVVKRDQSIIIQRDSTEVVTRDRSVQVKNNESHVVSVDQKLNVVGNQDVKVDANHNTTIGGTFERTVTGNVTTITDASRKDVVKGNDDHKVNGNLTTSADGTVTLSSGVAIVLAAPHIEEQVTGANSKIIGVPSGPLKMMAAKIQSMSGGDIDLFASANINMVSMESNTTVLGGNASGYIGMASDTMVGLARSSQLSLSMETVVGAALNNKLAVEMENVLGAKITTAAGPEVEMRTMKTISPGGGGGGPGVLSAGQTTAASIGVAVGALIGAKSFTAGFGELSDQYETAQQQLRDAARDAAEAGYPGLANRLNRLSDSWKFGAAWVTGAAGTALDYGINAGVGGLAGPVGVGVALGATWASGDDAPPTTYEDRRNADNEDSIGPGRSDTRYDDGGDDPSGGTSA